MLLLTVIWILQLYQIWTFLSWLDVNDFLHFLQYFLVWKISSSNNKIQLGKRNRRNIKKIRKISGLILIYLIGILCNIKLFLFMTWYKQQLKELIRNFIIRLRLDKHEIRIKWKLYGVLLILKMSSSPSISTKNHKSSFYNLTKKNLSYSLFKIIAFLSKPSKSNIYPQTSS